MKKLLSLAALALMLCVAGCQSNGYKITGSINGAQDGDTVMLRTGEDTLQTTVVSGGKFTFTGTQDSACQAYVCWETEDLTLFGELILENGDITIKLDTAENVPTEVTGTPNNDALTELNKAELALEKEAREVIAILNDADATDATKANAQARLGELQDEMIAVLQQFVGDHINLYIGRTYFEQYASGFDDDFVLAQLDVIPEAEYTQELKALKKNYEEKSATSAGKPFIDFKAATPEGVELSVGEVAAGAKVLLIDFWASWCGPCRAEMPNVKEVYEKFHAQGFEIIGVSLDNDAEAWKQAIADLGIVWPQISDLKGWDCEGAGLYAVRAIPATVLIKDGTIVARDLRGKQLAEKVEELIK